MNLLIFKMIAGASIAFFVRFSSKATTKKQIAHVQAAGLVWPIVLLKVLIFVPMFLYARGLFQATELRLPRDAVALAFSLAGAWLIAAARGSLGEYHTGAGYSLAETELVTDGVYAWIRHPIYTAFVLFSAGEALYLYARLSMFVFGLVVGITLANIAFCAFMAGRESGVLVAMFGAEGRRYQARVHPFLPLRKYEEPKKSS